MKTRCAILAAAICLATVPVGWALDSVKTTSATTKGKVTRIDRHTVVVVRGNISKEVPVNQIVMVYFDDDPTEMKTARSHLLNGRYEEALEALNKVNPQNVGRPEIKQDIEFYKAFCAARLALEGTGEIVAAGKKMATFVSAHKDSYHWLQANEVVADLLAAKRQYDTAETYYARLGQAPWPDYKMRAGVAVGRVRLAQGKTAAALESFEGVIANKATGDLAEAQRLAATLGKARCLSAEQKHDQAIALVEDVLAKADPELVDLHAQAYNALGTALRKAGRDKEALLSFLHVDVLYFTMPEAHAEALANLAELWEQVQKPERAVKARQILQERYGSSPWAKKGGA